MAIPLIAAAAAAVIGGIAGGQKDSTSGYQSGSSNSALQLRDFKSLNKGQSGLEAAGYNQQMSSFADLSKLLSFGPGQADVSRNQDYQTSFGNDISNMLQRLNNPSAQNISANYDQAKQIFAPQQTALDQQFTDANTASNRLSARLGRAGNDPILRNKLLQEKTRQQSTLNSQIGSYSANELPQQQASNLMNLGGALSNLRQGLATQAFTNRQTLLGLGNQLTNSERQYRIQTAQNTGNTYSSGEQLSGGGLKGAVTGAVGAFGGVMGGGK